MDELVRLRIESGVAYLTLNRPAKLNAISIPLRDALLEALASIRADKTIGCVVLDAEGRAFCAGQDLEERAPILDGEDMDLGQALSEGINRVIAELVALPQPSIAAVQGVALGAGASLALACDLVVMTPAAALDFGFVRLGLVPDSGASWLLPRKVGSARASMCLLTGARIGSTQSLAWGLASAVAETEPELRAMVEEMAANIARLPPSAVQATKTLLEHSGGQTLGGQLRREAEAQALRGRSQDYKKALARFLKRSDG
ncbi:enoyl-CoA hydratase/isomerase family protein [Devosia faecipullorum]|uniref:enoyl-CoA hydratase/isomerase family protein n=1 Tax=Devosia faecipullorum TaxID=2755039 RepID=UPI00187B36FF|nr:enoyl-CoA hydratase-related protein [Devosia faecipullorum]MBE7732923.1 enoyl-CoA hydratase/isomerase family protein [Devosia faecipullorum]